MASIIIPESKVPFGRSSEVLSVLLIGEGNSGKTAFVKNFDKNKSLKHRIDTIDQKSREMNHELVFNTTISSSTTVKFSTIARNINSAEVKTLNPNVDGIIYMFDISDNTERRQTPEKLTSIIQTLGLKYKFIIICANKCDKMSLTDSQMDEYRKLTDISKQVPDSTPIWFYFTSVITEDVNDNMMLHLFQSQFNKDCQWK